MIVSEVDRIKAEIRDGHIPSKRHLGLIDDCGVPVAHYVVKEFKMPANWAGWSISDSDGWTAAHVAATEDTLPVDFEQWDLADNEGVTVKEVHVEIQALNCEKEMPDFQDSIPEVIEDHRPYENPEDKPKRGVEFWLQQAQEILSKPTKHVKTI